MFFDFFSRKKQFGISIADTFVEVMQLDGDVKSPRISGIGHLDLPKGVVMNGEIQNPKVLSEIIQKLLISTKPKPIEGKECILSVSESQCFEHIFYAPLSFQGDELKVFMSEQIAKTLPIPSSELQYDYSVYSLPKTYVVFTVAMRKTVLAQYKNVLQSCGLSPVVFEPESLSLLRNIPADFDTGQISILVDAQPERINWFSLWSGLIFDANVIPHQDVNKLASLLFEDIQKSSISFQEKTSQAISKIVVLGKHKIISSLVDNLGKKLNIPIVVLEKYRLEIPGLADPSDFCIVSGAALRGLESEIKLPINLLKR